VEWLGIGGSPADTASRDQDVPDGGAARASDLTTARPETVASGMQTTFAVVAALMLVALAIALGSVALSQSAPRQ
jgi:hypothetical protein